MSNLSDLTLGLASIIPGLFVGVSGAALLRTRSRLAGVLMLLTALGLTSSALVRFAGADSAAQVLLVGAIMLPGAAAVLAYPQASVRHPVEFCAWVVVLGGGAIGTALTLQLGPVSGLVAVVPIALIAHGWLVLETADEPDRQAMLWLVLAVGTAGSIFSLLGLQFGPEGAVYGAMLLAAIGPAVVIGVRRPELADVRMFVVDMVVFGVAALTYVALFIGSGGVLELAGVDNPTIGVLAFIGVALAAGFQPLRTVLRGLIDELLFGERPDPLHAATEVAHRIGDDPLLALRAIREALVLPYASISASGVELAASGTPVTDVRRLSLSLGEESVGEMVVGLRPGDLTLSAGDEQVLRLVAPLLAHTLRARRLALDLKESRTTAVSAIEEERRRLRRDLHDGLGPTLSGIAHTADAARNSIASDPAAAAALLLHLRAVAADAVGEIRRLVYDMRPPALDELGLVAALRQQVAGLQTPSGRPMQVHLESPSLPPLPAGIEVAAYRIATEAVTNAARHSGTEQAWVALSCTRDDLTVSVRDAGSSAGTWVPGVGLSSMQERAAEVGGTLSVSTDSEGSVVRALLPLA